MKTNAPIGNNEPLNFKDLPTEPEVKELNLAKVGSSPEWKTLSEHLRDRISFYQQYLPGNKPVDQVSPEDLGAYWTAAVTIIQEFQAVISIIEGVTEAVSGVQKPTS